MNSFLKTKTMKTTIALFTLFLAQNCNQKDSKIGSQDDLPSPIEYVFFQKWVGGRQETGSGTDFEIKFKSDLPKGYVLSKLYFENKVSDFKSQGGTIYVANFFQKPNSPDMILDDDPKNEYGNQVPEDLKSQFNLQPNEAILEFTHAEKIEYYKLTKIKEKEFLAYPSAGPNNEN
jgi:hypothetical protein